ncbi:MAG: hypothetical protein Q9227_007133 [Pyrenula ochraceoflavens]
MAFGSFLIGGNFVEIDPTDPNKPIRSSDTAAAWNADQPPSIGPGEWTDSKRFAALTAAAHAVMSIMKMNSLWEYYTEMVAWSVDAQGWATGYNPYLAGENVATVATVLAESGSQTFDNPYPPGTFSSVIKPLLYDGPIFVENVRNTWLMEAYRNDLRDQPCYPNCDRNSGIFPDWWEWATLENGAWSDCQNNVPMDWWDNHVSFDDKHPDPAADE